ncbi:hypothetical protein fHeYen801_069 [Yersinia phage fHe-Yen8-01]|nr:hypothetical protein fHeYen801_069 [Yersinia phage fHe-Yen8-01]
MVPVPVLFQSCSSYILLPEQTISTCFYSITAKKRYTLRNRTGEST